MNIFPKELEHIKQYMNESINENKLSLLILKILKHKIKTKKEKEQYEIEKYIYTGLLLMDKILLNCIEKGKKFTNINLNYKLLEAGRDLENQGAYLDLCQALKSRFNAIEIYNSRI